MAVKEKAKKVAKKVKQAAKEALPVVAKVVLEVGKVYLTRNGLDAKVLKINSLGQVLVLLTKLDKNGKVSMLVNKLLDPQTAATLRAK